MEWLASLYEAYVFNPLLDRQLRRVPEIVHARAALLQDVDQAAGAAQHGAGTAAQQPAVLEIGPGTGLNIPHYPRGLARLHTLALEPENAAAARRRAAERGLQLLPCSYETRSAAAAAGHLSRDQAAAAADAGVDHVIPFGEGTFDHVVCTLVLCTVPRPHALLAEVARVLKPGGSYRFLEHVATQRPEQRSVLWRGYRRVHSALGLGCDLGRRSEESIAQHLCMVRCEDVPFRSRAARWAAGKLVYGVAVKPL